MKYRKRKRLRRLICVLMGLIVLLCIFFVVISNVLHE